MSAVLFYLPFPAAAKPTNIGVPGAKAYFYAPGTTTLRAVYATSALTTPLSNPVIADGAGRFPAIYLDNALSYKLAITDKLGANVITPIDPYIPGTAPDASSLTPYSTAAAASAAASAASAASADADAVGLSAAVASASASASAATAAASAVAAILLSGTGIVSPRFTPEAYMAPGRVEGTTDDGPALAAMSAAVNALGSGAVDFYTGRTYWVGSQSLNAAGPTAVAGATMRYAPNTPYPVEINGCTGPVVINMNGAKIKCLPSKRYGSFNADGTDYVGQATLPAYAGTPYFAMILVHNCTGSVVVRNGELDGNIAAQNIGGGYGVNTIQFPMYGIQASDNTGPIIIDAIHSHHHGSDGGLGDGLGTLKDREIALVSNSRFLNNGRQGWSHVGGNGWHFHNCDFSQTGRDIGGMTYSLPGAGFDLEAAGGSKYTVNTKFTKCRFSDCAGLGFLLDASSTNSFDATFDECDFIGTTTNSVWPDRPGCVFTNCRIIGAMVNLHNNADLTKAATFKRCLITDDVTLSPTGAVYLASGILVVGAADGVQFQECHWQHTQNIASPNGGVGNFSTGAGMRLHNCFVENTVAANFLVYGIYSGDQTHIKGANTMPDPGATVLFLHEAGPALDSYLYENNLGGFAIALARYPGNLDALTGKRIYFGSATYNPPSLALAAKDTIQTMTVTGAALGDKVEDVSFSVNLAGARIHSWVSATDTVSYYFVNENGANPLDLASGTVRVKVRQA